MNFMLKNWFVFGFTTLGYISILISIYLNGFSLSEKFLAGGVLTLMYGWFVFGAILEEAEK